jgi:hypothetical protein
VRPPWLRRRPSPLRSISVALAWALGADAACKRSQGARSCWVATHGCAHVGLTAGNTARWRSREARAWPPASTVPIRQPAAHPSYRAHGSLAENGLLHVCEGGSRTPSLPPSRTPLGPWAGRWFRPVISHPCPPFVARHPFTSWQRAGGSTCRRYVGGLEYVVMAARALLVG